MTSTSTSRVPEAGLLSREATAAVGSAFNTLSETVKKHEPSLEDVVRDTLRPMLKSWLDENLGRVADGRDGNRTGHSRTLTTRCRNGPCSEQANGVAVLRKMSARRSTCTAR